MEKIKELNRYQKGILILLVAMAVIFGILYAKAISKTGFLYKDKILEVSQKYRIDVDEEKLVQILKDDRTRYDEAYKKGYADGMNYFKEKLMRRFANKMYKELMEGDFEDEV